MSRAQVREILGSPDDVWLGDEVNACRLGWVHRPGTEAWTYGGNGHLTFPTLGKVSFDPSGKVVAVTGREGPLPGPGLPPEAETRRIFRLIDRLRGGLVGQNDPLRVIQVVNALQPLGKTPAFAVMDEYLRVKDPIDFQGGTEALDVAAAALFELPNSPDRTPRTLFVNERGGPIDTRYFWMPVIILGDIPLVAPGGGILAGSRGSMRGRLQIFREKGVLRARPLRPVDNPLEALDGLFASSVWFRLKDDPYTQPAWLKRSRRENVREQMLRLVDPVYRLDDDLNDDRLTYRPSVELAEADWRDHVRRLAEIHPHWDAERCTYVRPDGTSIAPQPDLIWSAQRWKVEMPPGDVAVVLKRVHRTWVDYGVRSHGVKPSVLRLFVGGDEIGTRSTLRLSGDSDFSGGFPTLDGRPIQLRIEQEGKVVQETVMRV